jgi:hypothetical protein
MQRVLSTVAGCLKNGQPDACTFEPSQRGKRRNQKTEAMAKNLEKMVGRVDRIDP